MKNASLILVRPHPERSDCNDAADMETAAGFAKDPPCWVLVIGAAESSEKSRRREEAREANRVKRLDAMRGRLGLDGIAGKGITVLAPVEVHPPTDDAPLAEQLARYLADGGLRTPLRQAGHVDVRLPADLDPLLLAAVVEAVAVYPRADVWLGDRRLRSSLRWELRRDQFRAPPPAAIHDDLIGTTPAIEEVRDKIRRYADQPLPVLVIGETGTGKEVVATMLRAQSAREGRFMAQNAAQLPTELADSLLFGHRKGAFTGADRDRLGRIRETQGGTFFLDEAFNLAPAVQGKLLRALNRVDEGIVLVEPVGSADPPVVVHARLVISALGDPRQRQGDPGTSTMRADLFYRVSAGIIRLPPLRETLDDLPRLCRGLLSRLGRQVDVSEDGIAVLRDHSWPGNVRELRLILMRALIDAPAGTETLGADHLCAALDTNRLPSGARALDLPCDLRLELKRIEVATMRAALRQAGDVGAKAGRHIGMGKTARNFMRTLEAAQQVLDGASTGETQ